MSTSKIGKSFNPKKAVNPSYGKIDQPKKEEVDKLAQALDLLTEQIKVTSELVKTQNQAIELIFQKMQNLEKRMFKLENDTKESIKQGCEEILSGVSSKVDELKSEPTEEPQKKSWF